jgi:hypothetical protein
MRMVYNSLLKKVCFHSSRRELNSSLDISTELFAQGFAIVSETIQCHSPGVTTVILFNVL